MKLRNLSCLLATTVCFLSPLLRAQQTPVADSLPPVVSIAAASGSAWNPQHSPFFPEICRLGKQPYDLVRKAWLSDESVIFPPDMAAPYRRMGWLPDAAYPDYYWATVHADSGMTLFRYDRPKARVDSFPGMLNGELIPGKAGVWFSDHRQLQLIDRHTGRVIRRKANPQPGLLMWLRPWGDDVLVTERRLYVTASDTFIAFVPQPAEVQECRPAEEVFCLGEACISRAYDGNRYVNFLSTPGNPPLRLPFSLSGSLREHLVALNPPLAWFCFPDRLVSVDCVTGDSVVYPAPVGEAIPGDQSGPFMGFRSERGLCFFDKSACSFSFHSRPWGFERPRDFRSNRYGAILTFENHWETVDCRRLDAAFASSDVLDEFRVFEREWNIMRVGLDGKDFYTCYAVWSDLFGRYGRRGNAKIDAYWPHVLNALDYALFKAGDSIMERVDADFRAQRLAPEVARTVAASFFRYRGSRGEIAAALEMAQVLGDDEFEVASVEYYSYLLGVLRSTKRQLDSLADLKLLPDEKLYAAGKLWLGYCPHKQWFRYSYDPRGNYEQAYTFFRELIRRFPDSPLADNAACDTMYFVDYVATTTDDETPDGDPVKARQTFLQFLSDYPDSEKRPEIMLRLVRLLLRISGYGGEDANSMMAEAALYMDSVAAKYPAYTDSIFYKQAEGRLKGQLWQQRWMLGIAPEKTQYTSGDSIRFIIRVINRSRSEQVLPAAFLENWQAGLQLHISLLRDRDCAPLFGDFPLVREKNTAVTGEIKIPSGAFYEERLLMLPASKTRNHYPGSFALEAGSTYLYNLEYRHPQLPWLTMYVNSGGRFDVK